MVRYSRRRYPGEVWFFDDTTGEYSFKIKGVAFFDDFKVSDGDSVYLTTFNSLQWNIIIQGGTYDGVILFTVMNGKAVWDLMQVICAEIITDHDVRELVVNSISKQKVVIDGV